MYVCVCVCLVCAWTRILCVCVCVCVCVCERVVHDILCTCACVRVCFVYACGSRFLIPISSPTSHQAARVFGSRDLLDDDDDVTTASRERRRHRNRKRRRRKVTPPFLVLRVAGDAESTEETDDTIKGACVGGGMRACVELVRVWVWRCACHTSCVMLGQLR